MTLTSAARCQPVWPGDRGSEGLPAGAGGAQRPVLSVRVGGPTPRALERCRWLCRHGAADTGGARPWGGS